jgi:hypothetical protein
MAKGKITHAKVREVFKNEFDDSEFRITVKNPNFPKNSAWGSHQYNG